MVNGIGSSNNDLTARLAEMREKYNSMDSDSDGKVSKEEFLAAFKNDQANGAKGKPPMGPPPGPPPSGSTNNANSSNSSTNSTTGTKKSAEDIFNEIDTNGDGYISVTENEDFLKKMQQNMLKQLEQYNNATTSLVDYLKSSDSTDSGNSTNDIFAAFKNDLQQLLQKYGLYNDQGTKTGTSAQNSILDIKV